MGKASRKKKDLSFKVVPGRVKLHLKMLYQGVIIYIRSYDKFLFQYDFAIKGEIFSDYNIITPRVGVNSLSAKEIDSCVKLTAAAAFATVDYQLNIKQSDIEKARSEAFLEAGEKAFGGKPAQT